MHKKIPQAKRRMHLARKSRVKNKIATDDRAWLTIFRSNKHMYAQIVDATTGRTLASASTRSKDVLGDAEGTGGVEAAKRVGMAIARQAQELQIEKVVFNRNGFLYHGRVKAVADGAREAGLEF